MKKALVIGGAGFIGQHLVKKLLNDGFEVKVLTRNNDFNFEGIEVCVGDYRDVAVLRSALLGVSYVIHLAHGSIQIAQTPNMIDEWERNILPSIQLMEECIKFDVERLIYVSSGVTVYGEPASLEPIKENAATSPISLYGISKLSTEQTARFYSVQKNLPVIIVRPANAYGPGQLPFKGQGLIATAMGSILKDMPITLYGDGSAIRDYVHVRDVAQAIVRLLNFGDIGEVYNIGTGIGTSISQLLNEHLVPLFANSEYKMDCHWKVPRGVDVSYNVLDTKKISLIMPYSPTRLDHGLAETWVWMLKYLGSKK